MFEREEVVVWRVGPDGTVEAFYAFYRKLLAGSWRDEGYTITPKTDWLNLLATSGV